MRRMIHPEHGYHVPMNSLNREEMLAEGWIDEPEKPAPLVQYFAEAAAEQVALEPKRRGRPPKAKE